MKKNVVAFIVVTGVLALFLSQSAIQVKAAFPEGLWMFESKVLSDGKDYSTNGVCIKSNGKWEATTSPSGKGSWYLKDNRLYLHGNYDTSASGYPVNISFELTPSRDKKTITGIAQEWDDTNAYNGYYTTIWTFKSACLETIKKQKS